MRHIEVFIFTECFDLSTGRLLTRPFSQNIHTGQTNTTCTVCEHLYQLEISYWLNFSRAEMGILNPL